MKLQFFNIKIEKVDNFDRVFAMVLVAAITLLLAIYWFQYRKKEL